MIFLFKFFVFSYLSIFVQKIRINRISNIILQSGNPYVGDLKNTGSMFNYYKDIQSRRELDSEKKNFILVE